MKNYILFLFFLIFIVSCKNTAHENKASDTSKGIVVQDTQGNEVRLDSVAQRIVCLFDPSVDIIYMLQSQDKLVGIPAETYFDKELYDYYKLIDDRILNKELPTPGSNDVANIESLVALRPDLVIAQQLPESTIFMLKDMGIAVYISTSDTYANLMKEMKDISIMVGKQQRGKQLISYAQDKVEELQKRASLKTVGAQPKSVYFTWANGRIYSTAGRKSMMNNCLELAGVDNACPSDIDKPNINPETLISWNPDMIVMWNDSPDLFYNKKELSSVKAIENKQIYNLMPMFFYNPHTFKSLCAAVAINNWAYADNTDDALNETKEIITELYGEQQSRELIKNL